MGIIIDIIIILLIALSVFFGYRKGLIALGIQLVAFAIALIITFILYRPIANVVINSTTLDEKLQATITTNADKFLEEKDEDRTQNKLIQSAKQGMLPEASRTLSINIIYGATMLILYVIAKICLLLIKSLADTIAKLPILKQFNRLGGAVYGLLRGLLITYAILLVLNLVISVNPKSQLNELMNDAYVAKTMSTYNVLNLFLK